VFDEDSDCHWNDEGDQTDGDHVVGDVDALVSIPSTEDVNLIENTIINEAFENT
jgi:regulator of RNase E activity RraA